MLKKGKRFLEASKKIDVKKKYNIDEAFVLLKEITTAKFDETIEAHVKLGIDNRIAEQQVRSTVTMPHGTGKKNKILVFTRENKKKEAMEAGANYVGLDDLVNKIKKGWIDFDVVIATPDTMSIVGKLGKILGPKGLMPNPKVGTVTQDIIKAIKEIKAGKIEFRVDKNGIIHIGFAKASFSIDKIKNNFKVLMNAIINSRPSSIKGTYIKSITIKPTMGPGIKIEPMINFK